MFRDEVREYVYRRVRRARLQMQIGQQQRRVGKVGGDVLELGLRLLDVARRKIREGQVVTGGSEARLCLEHCLKVLDGVDRLTAGEADATAEQPALEVGGVFLEHRRERLDGVVVASLDEGDFGQAAPAGQEIRRLGRDVLQHAFAVIGPLHREIEVRQSQPRHGPDRPQRGGRLIRPLRLLRVAPGPIKVAQDQLGVDGRRLTSDRLLEGPLGALGQVLAQVQKAEADMKLRPVAVEGSSRLEAPDLFVDFRRRSRRGRGEQETFEVVRVPREGRRRLRAGILGTAGQDVERGEPAPHVDVLGIELFRLQQEGRREAELPGLKVGHGQSRDGVRVVRLDAEGIHVFDDRLREPLAVEVAIGA